MLTDAFGDFGRGEAGAIESGLRFASRAEVAEGGV